MRCGSRPYASVAWAWGKPNSDLALAHGTTRSIMLAAFAHANSNTRPKTTNSGLKNATISRVVPFRKQRPAGGGANTVTDSKGHYVDGLTPSDLILYNNNVAQKIQMD